MASTDIKSRYNQKVADSGTAAQKKKTNKWRGLQDDDTWQNGYYQSAKLREINFWFGTLATEGPAARPKRR